MLCVCVCVCVKGCGASKKCALLIVQLAVMERSNGTTKFEASSQRVIHMESSDTIPPGMDYVNSS